MARTLVAINGFGRIGRCVTRAMENQRELSRLKAIADIAEGKNLSHLLKYDSAHGTFEPYVGLYHESLFIGSDLIRLIPAREHKSPRTLPWAKFKDSGDKLIVVESSGIYTDTLKAREHLEAGADYVLISAPAIGEKPDLTLVWGANHELLDPSKQKVISLASCTTNSLAPVVKVLNDAFGIKNGIITTIHAATNDQHVADQPHRDLRRARATGVNIIPTTTGAAKAIGEVIPALAGKLDGDSRRVPVLLGSITEFFVNFKISVTKEDIDAALRKASQNIGRILGYSEEPLVSSDYIGCTQSGIVDALSTIVIGDRTAKVSIWYDNETAFSHRVVETIAAIANLIGSD